MHLPVSEPPDRRRSATAQVPFRRIVAAGAIVVALVGCVGADAGDGPRAAVRETPPTDTTGDANLGRLAGVDGWRDVEVDGVSRRVRVVVPDGVPADAPVVVGLHGRGAGVDHLLAQSDLDATADARGFILVLPEARGARWTVTGGDEDVRFVAAAVADLVELGHVGPGTFALVGFSQGGSMAMRIAADRPEQVAGVATVASQLPEAVTPTGPVPTLLVYGTRDPLRPVAGLPAAAAGEGPDAPDPTVSATASAEAFAAVAGVSSPPLAAPLDAAPALRCRFPGGEVAVVLLLVTDGGHTWPGTSFEAPEERFGPTSRAFDATEVVTDFVLDGAVPGGTATAAAESPDPTCGVG